MRFLFHLGHPAHFHLLRHPIGLLRSRGHETFFTVKPKDVLESLLRDEGLDFVDLQPGGRGPGALGAAAGLAVRARRLLAYARRVRPDAMAGTSAEIAIVGRLLGIPSIVLNEDDHDVVPLFATVAYPLASAIAAPVWCRMGRWTDRTIPYRGFHELAYLHPERFAPDPGVAESLGAPPSGRYSILRLARLTAHHDRGVRGIDDALAERLVALLEPHGRVHVSAERELPPSLRALAIPIEPRQMHSALAGARLYVGDSQTMAAEAAVLGVPSVRCNDFVGRIGYLEALEHEYGLTVGVPASDPERLCAVVAALASDPDASARWAGRRAAMLADTVDVAALLADLIEGMGRPHGSGRGGPARGTIAALSRGEG